MGNRRRLVPQLWMCFHHLRDYRFSPLSRTTNNLSGTLTSLDDSTPENMSKLMALGHKTLHDPVFAIPEAGSNWDTRHRFAGRLSEEQKACLAAA
ncbi:unnamed protein product [Sphagnum jensenii]|uniref:Uncharacterized protein n=1 Tax=Sphagnum jensenii TaxID=128206 RepID=A0ABP1BJT0_9BRYO